MAEGVNFNPRSHEGSDILRVEYQIWNSIFQPTLPRGERPLKYIQFLQYGKFQPTLPRGERRIWETSLPGMQTHFNPRSHEGSDYKKLHE